MYYTAQATGYLFDDWYVCTTCFIESGNHSRDNPIAQTPMFILRIKKILKFTIFDEDKFESESQFLQEKVSSNSGAVRSHQNLGKKTERK